MRRLKTLYNQLPFFIFIKLLFQHLYRKIDKNAIFCYSHYGEDIIINDFFSNKAEGFYIDVGCNHPMNGSNTFKFYLNGWTGIAIDGNESLIRKFKKIRPKDISLNKLVSDNEQIVTFYISEEDKVSTVEPTFLESRKNTWKYLSQIEMKTSTLSSIIEQYMPPNKKIDFLTIDVEGHDYNVIKSLDLNIYRPKLILIEMHDFQLNLNNQNKIYQYLVHNGYRLAYFAVNNGFFIDETS